MIPSQSSPAKSTAKPRLSSIRRRLIVPIIASLITFFAIDAVYQYREMLNATNTAYDRTLLASARAIGDGVKYAHETLTVSLPYPALEVFEADVRSRMVFRVSDQDGVFVSGYKDLPAFKGKVDDRPPYAALVTFYEDMFRGDAVRVAALYQPVNTGNEYRMALVQVAETLELRRRVAQQASLNSLTRQIAVTALLAFAVWWLVGRGVAPLLRLRNEVLARDQDSLEPLSTKTARELVPLVEALNEVMSRLKRVLENRQRFVRDASHQLRTPLAVLKVQVQNARQGLVEPYQALTEIEDSVNRATRVANQMLALAKVAELGDDTTDASSNYMASDLVTVCRDIAVECSPLLSAKRLDFSLEGAVDEMQPVRGADWLLRELLRNLLSNAIEHSPDEGAVGFVIVAAESERRIYVWDSGKGIDPEQRQHLFQPFATGNRATGTGLGLVICRDICAKIGADLSLKNRSEVQSEQLPESAVGCVAQVIFPTAPINY
jgi:two-component system, OmpR family, sensor histidine kinase TctE